MINVKWSQTRKLTALFTNVCTKYWLKNIHVHVTQQKMAKTEFQALDFGQAHNKKALTYRTLWCSTSFFRHKTAQYCRSIPLHKVHVHVYTYFFFISFVSLSLYSIDEKLCPSSHFIYMKILHYRSKCIYMYMYV